MNCPFLDLTECCNMKPIFNFLYDPSTDELKSYCTNELDMTSCPRRMILEGFLRASRGKGDGTSITNVNTNTNRNTNTLLTSLSVEVVEAFELAKATVEAKKNLSEDEKDAIYGRLLVLERELAKGQGNIDKGKIQRLKEGFEKYGWLIPTVIDILKKCNVL